jgi:hypothetical protein
LILGLSKATGAYVRLGSNTIENPGGIGHNFGSGAIKTIPIVLNAGETLSINSDGAHVTFWAHLIEFDATSPLARADIGISAGTGWIAGDNELPITIAEGSTIGFGIPGFNQSNNPPSIITGFALINQSAAAVTYTGPFIVPAGATPSASPGSANQFAGGNTLFSGGTFFKYFPGGMAPGDTIVINSNSGATGQIGWTNYWLI